MSKKVYNVRDWLAAADKEIPVLDDQLRQATQRLEAHDRARQELATREAAALDELLSALFPALTPAAVAQALAWTGYHGLRQHDPLAERDGIKARLHARITEIGTDPAYVNREALRDPDVGTLTQSLAEAQDHLRPLSRVRRRAAHPRLQRLLDSGYGTPDYDVAWWRLSYYSDWKAGDEVLEQFPDHETFGAFRDYYLELQQSWGTLKARVDELQAEWDYGEGLLRELDECRAELGTLDEDVLVRTRERLRAFVVDSGAHVFAGRLGDHPEVELAAKRWAGLSQQGHYLDQLREHQLLAWQRRMREGLSKLKRKRAKLRNPRKAGKRFPHDSFHRTFKDRSDKYEKHWSRYDRGLQNLLGFDRYVYVDFSDDELYWDLFHDGRLSGSWLPEVRAWRERRADYRYRRWKQRERDRRVVDRDDDDGWDDEQEAAAAAAVAHTDYDDGDDAGFSDIS